MNHTRTDTTLGNGKIRILHRDDLQLGGFAGLKEHRLVMDAMAFGSSRNSNAWQGLGNFVYLADARFVPHGETGMHPHRELDVISVMVDGRIVHGGSLSDGRELVAPEVQVQRAGGEGFMHNEVNPDEVSNRMIQLWVLPERAGEPAGYKVYSPEQGEVTRVYGGEHDQQETFASRTVMDVAMLNAEQHVRYDGLSLVYVTKGRGIANGVEVADGDLLQSDGLDFTALEQVQMIVIHLLD